MSKEKVYTIVLFDILYTFKQQLSFPRRLSFYLTKRRLLNLVTAGISVIFAK